MRLMSRKTLPPRPSNGSKLSSNWWNGTTRMPIHKDLRQFIESLNSNGVDYLIVGAYAVAWHGYPRFTADIDILVRPVPGNADAVLAALRAFGFGSLDITREDLSQGDQVIQLGAKPNRIDLIASIYKESTGRPKDLGDAAELRKRHPG